MNNTSNSETNVLRGDKYLNFIKKVPIDKDRYVGDIFKKVVGNKVIGKYVDVLEDVGRYQQKMYIIDSDRLDEKYDKIFGCKSLDRQMSEILIGDIIEIEYLGKKVTSQKEYHEYKVSRLYY